MENDQRQALTDQDRAVAFHQLSLLGVSATQIIRKTGAKKTVVDAALKVRANDTASAALAGGMTLDMAAIVEEFSDDEDAVARLERTAAENPQSFTHRPTEPGRSEARRRNRRGHRRSRSAGAENRHRERPLLRLQGTDRSDGFPVHRRR